MPAKRKLENFDPNKSDSDDTNFDPTESRPSGKKSRKSSSKRGSGNPKKRTKRRHRGSDESDDDVDDSLLDESFSESEEEEEEPEVNPSTGRRVRAAAKKPVHYEEDSDSDISEVVPDIRKDDSADEEAPKKLLLKLKFTPKSTRSTRVTSRRSVEPTSAGITRRSKRGTTPAEADLVALSDSGNHILREGHSPEPVRATRGSKGLKKPASTIKEEIHETSSYEQDVGNTTMATDIAGTDDQDEEEAVSKPDEPKNVEDTVADELGEEDDEPAAQPAVVIDDDDDEDEIPITRTRTRGSRAGVQTEATDADVDEEPVTGPRRLTRGSKSKSRKSGVEQSSDFEPVEDDASEDEISASDSSPKKAKGDDSDSSSAPTRGRRAAKSKSSSRRRSQEYDVDPDELAEEVQSLRKNSRKRARHYEDPSITYDTASRRTRKPVDYKIKAMDEIYQEDEQMADAMAATPTRRQRGGASQRWDRTLYSTFGPFGGGGGPAPIIGGPWGTGAIGGVDSDSSDDENMQRPPGVGGNVGMTPTTAFPPGLLPGLGQANPADPIAGMSGTPANLGKVKSQKALADADPLGVDQNVDFSKIGGLEGHIDHLKEMVQMPLLYPELFLKFHVTPPRGVLFHGPPGTGKTLLARALAAQVGSGGRKITFYMRKGADALSKWVGEAERQLRLLFEEARKTQPSIIFFDEIDGLAPVRSSKQEQIHASIVSTLLALMDGMDGRGQVIVIGATNRPDNIDPALRRPGRFDREFYFPLPDIAGRKSILNIHTKDWGIDDAFKNSLAHVTKGYGGADLRALCTEAALNAIQRTYPQIYSSNDKLLVDADKIKVTAKDFMLSVKKMVPSSERSTSSGAVPLPKVVEPVLKDQLKAITDILDSLIPIKKKSTALQEAMYEQYEDEDQGFGRETLQQDFERSRVFRPRLLICGEPGMGQSYLGGAILNHFEGLHVQSFDLPTIFSDSARSPENAIVQLFAEVKRHKPSVIYLPGVDTWYHTLSDAVITTFLGLLRSIPPTDPVLVLGITDTPADKISPDILRDLFGFSKNNRFTIGRPNMEHRVQFFATIGEYVKKAPKDFPEPLNRKKRKLEVLKLAPPPPVKPPSKEEIKAQKKRDHQVLNLLKVQIQPIMDQIQRKYKKFRTPVILPSQIQYLLDEQEPGFIRGDVPQLRPYEVSINKDGVKGLLETETGRFFYNLETTTIEERLSNGYYARARDFLADIKSLAKDAKHGFDRDRLLKANELLANVEVDIAAIENNPSLADCENVYLRQMQRAKEKEEKLKRRQAKEGVELEFESIVRSDLPAGTSEDQSGPLILGEPIPHGPRLLSTVMTPSRLSNGHSGDSSGHNGNSVPSRIGEDISMGGTDDEFSQAMHPPHHPSMTSTRPNTQISTQRSNFMREIPHDTSPKDLINDASTTTSGKKTSSQSQPTSNERWSTQATNGITNNNSSSPIDRPAQDSDLPDTQRATQEISSEEWTHSQAHALARGNLGAIYPSQTPSSGSQASQPQPTPLPAVPPFNTGPRMPLAKSRPSGFANLLNDSPVDPSSSQVSSQKEIILDEHFVDEILSNLVTKTSGCSIEQLEQINRELMNALWKLRGEYNRNLVATNVIEVFNETIADIEEMQRVLAASQEQEEEASQFRRSQYANLATQYAR